MDELLARAEKEVSFLIHTLHRADDIGTAVESYVLTKFIKDAEALKFKISAYCSARKSHEDAIKMETNQ